MFTWKSKRKIIRSLPVQKTIAVRGESLVYTLQISNKIRGIRLAVHHDASLRVTVSKRVSEKQIRDSIAEKIDWIVEKMEHFKKNPRKVLGTGGVNDFEMYKDGALIRVLERLNHFNRFYSYRWNNVTIKNTKSRWGSCSKMGNLNFSYKLALLPPHLTDYIVIHELCHLKEMNHGKNFWKLVAQTMPNYRDLRKQLKGVI